MSKKQTRYVAVYRHEGKLLHAERTSAREYRFASVVQWSDGRVAIGVRWSTTEKGAAACLTKQQRDNGAKVITVVTATPQPDLSAFSRQMGKLLDPKGD
jgi:hypothetical protein